MRTPADLRQTFLAIDRIFFHGRLQRDGVKCRWKRFRPLKNTVTFAECDVEEREIRMNYILADTSVPDYVVAAVLHHEILHITVGYDHTPAFFREEHKFPFYYESEEWCDKYILGNTESED